MKKFFLPVALLVAFLVAFLASPHAATQRGNRFTEFHGPAANTVATITHAAVAGKQHIAECIVASFAAGTTAPAAIIVNVLLRDGATGVGTIIFSQPLSLSATGGIYADTLQICGLNIPGTAGNAMTLEFSAVGGANTTEAVFIQGRTE